MFGVEYYSTTQGCQCTAFTASDCKVADTYKPCWAICCGNFESIVSYSGVSESGTSCALNTLGVLYCWGGSGFSTIGTGTVSSFPRISFDSDFDSIKDYCIGGSHMCYISENLMRCLGKNDSGQKCHNLGCSK